MMNSARSKSLLGYRKPIAFAAEQITLRHTTVFVSHFRVTRVIAAFISHHVDVANESEPGRRYRHDDLACPLVLICDFGIRDRHHNGEARAVGSRRKPLVTVDHVVITAFHGGGAHPGDRKSTRLNSSHLVISYA